MAWPLKETLQAGKSLAAQTSPFEWRMIRRALNSLVSGTHVGITVNANSDGTLQLVATAENLLPPSSADFEVLYGLSGAWVTLEPGNEGEHLTTHAGVSAPTWEDPQGNGGEVPVASTEGEIMYDDGTDWVSLAVGTAGQKLQTNGVDAVPSWVTGELVATGGVLGDVLYHDDTSFVRLAAAAATPPPLGKNGHNLLRSDGVAAPFWSNEITLPQDVTGGELVAFDGDPGGGPPDPQWVKVLQGPAGYFLITPGDTAAPFWQSPEASVASAFAGDTSGFVKFSTIGPAMLTQALINGDVDLFAGGTHGDRRNIITASNGTDVVMSIEALDEAIGNVVTPLGTDGQILESYDKGGGVRAVQWIDPPTGTVAAAGTQGNVLYDDGVSWVALAVGTDGQHLTTHAASANPTWEDVAALPVGVIGDVLIHDGTNFIPLNAGTNFQVLTTKGVGVVPIFDFVRAH